MVARLYAGQQCEEDGLRFPSPPSLASHAAWLEQVRALAAAGSGGSAAKGAKGKVLPRATGVGRTGRGRGGGGPGAVCPRG